MRRLLYFGAVCGALSAIVGAGTHDIVTVVLGIVCGFANWYMAEHRTEKE